MSNPILEGLRQASTHANGGFVNGIKEHRIKVPDNIDVKAIRSGMNLSQAEFACKFGFSVATIRNWEQGARIPGGATRAFLTVIQKRPEAVLEALEAA